MTVKIVDADNSKRVTCSRCGVMLEFLPNDIELLQESDDIANGRYIEFVTCPECNSKTRTRPGFVRVIGEK